MSHLIFLFLHVLLLVNLKASVQQLAETTTKPHKIKDSLVLPLILKKRNENNIKRFTLLTTSSSANHLVDAANEDVSPIFQESQEKNAVVTKASKTDDWNRANYYIPTHLKPLKFSSFNGYDTGPMNAHNLSSALPATVMILINLGILSYVLVGILGFLNQLLHSNTGFTHGGYENNAQFYFKSSNNDDFQ